jgi:hypothetical protein
MELLHHSPTTDRWIWSPVRNALLRLSRPAVTCTIGLCIMLERDDDSCEEGSACRKHAPVFRPSPQIPHDMTRDRALAVAVGCRATGRVEWFGPQVGPRTSLHQRVQAVRLTLSLVLQGAAGATPSPRHTS